MVNPKIKKLAKILVDYSVAVEKNDRVLVECSDPAGLDLAKAVYQQALLKGAYPYLNLGTEELAYFFFQHASQEQLKAKPEVFEFMVDWLDKAVRIKAMENTHNLANVKTEKLLLRQRVVRPIADRLLEKDWVLTYFPTPAVAQQAKMSLEELEAFYFKACLRDWQAVDKRLKQLKAKMDNAQEVKVVGEKTDLQFSLKGRLAKAAAGKCNMPDGEVFSAPLDGTMTGTIYFDFPSLRSGKEVREIQLEFEKGQVVKATAGYNQAFLREVLETDEGASRPGEFAIGANYGIKQFMFNTLFDEKIGGTIHLALGKAYEEKEGGGQNKSAIHWDLVKDMRKKGSQVIIDGQTVLKDGKILV